MVISKWVNLGKFGIVFEVVSNTTAILAYPSAYKYYLGLIKAIFNY